MHTKFKICKKRWNCKVVFLLIHWKISERIRSVKKHFWPIKYGEVVFIFESRDTGEVEPGPEGEQLPIVELDLHQYADMVVLKNNLSPRAYDDVRQALGLEPLAAAAAKGQEITQNIRKNISEN